MTVFLCCLTAFAMLRAPKIKADSVGLPIAIYSLYAVLATLAAWSWWVG